MSHLLTRRRRAFALMFACLLLCLIAPAYAGDETSNVDADDIRALESEVMLIEGLWKGTTIREDDEAHTPVDATPASQTDSDGENEPTLAPVPSNALSIPPPLDPPPLKALSVMLDWHLSPQHAALLIADERELFKDQGLAVDIQSPADPTIALKLLAAEEIDLALTREPILHLQIHAGEPLIRIGTLIETPLNAVVVVGQAPERDDITMLAGLDYGFSTREGERIVAERLIPQSLRQTDDFTEPVNVHFDAAAAVVRGDAQIIADGYFHSLPEQLAPEGIESYVIRYEEIDIPRHDGVIVVANSHSLAKHGHTWARFMTAVEQASHWMIENPDQAWQLLTEHYPILDNPVNQANWHALLRRMSLSPAAVNSRRYQAFEAYLHQRGIIDEILPVSRLSIDPHALGH